MIAKNPDSLFPRDRSSFPHRSRLPGLVPPAPGYWRDFLPQKADYHPEERQPFQTGQTIRRVLLILVGHKSPDFFLVTPALGIMYLSSYLKDMRPELETRLHDMKIANTSYSDLARLAREFRPDLIGLSVITPNSGHLLPVSRHLKAALPEVPLVVGGAHASSVREKVFYQAPVDFVLTGEGEEALWQLIQTLENLPARPDPEKMDAGLSRVPGLFYLSAENQQRVYCQSNSPKIEDLDRLPFPDWSAVDLKGYQRNFTMTPVGKRRYMAIYTSRGCPYRCYYCHDNFGKSFRYRSVNNVVDEIEILARDYQITDFEIIDDIFNFNKDRVLAICAEITRRNLKIGLTFPNGLRGDLLNREVLEALNKAGAYFISFAIESATSRIQKQIKKFMNLEKIRENINIAARLGIFCNGFFMLGFPGESREEIRATIDFAVKSRLHTASFFIVTPYAGTGLFDSLAAEPEKRELDFERSDLIFGQANCSDLSNHDLYRLQRLAHLKFYLRPVRALRILRDLPGKRHFFSFFQIFWKRITRKTP